MNSRLFSESSSQLRVWIVSELFYPEDTSTGYYMTRIAEWLAKRWDVHAIAAQPTYGKKGQKADQVEEWRGVQIKRCPSSTLDKNNLLYRLVNALTISSSMLFREILDIRRGDVVLVVTNPPILPFVTLAACKARGARCILRIDDVYPDAMAVAGLIKAGGSAELIGNYLERFLLSSVDAISVLGRCMESRVEQKLGRRSKKIRVIPNWSDSRDVFPTPKEHNVLLKELGLTNKFIVLIAGNIGRVQDVVTVVDCAISLRHLTEIHFIFVGSGAMVPWIKLQIKEKGLKNISHISNRPRSEQCDFLNACDVALITLCKGMWGLGVPSRFYNHMAAGKPIIVMIDEESEVSRVVREEGIGWVVEPGNANGLAKCLREAMLRKAERETMGLKARKLAVEKYQYDIIVQQYEKLVAEVIGGEIQSPQ